MKLINGTKWAHVACVDLIPDMYFVDEKKENVVFLNGALHSFTQAQCSLCDKKDGVTIKVI